MKNKITFNWKLIPFIIIFIAGIIYSQTIIEFLIQLKYPLLYGIMIFMLIFPFSKDGNIYSVFWGINNRGNVYCLFGIYQRASGTTISLLGSCYQHADDDAWTILGISTYQNAKNNAFHCFGISCYQEAQNTRHFIGLSVFQKAEQESGNYVGISIYQHSQKDTWQSSWIEYLSIWN